MMDSEMNAVESAVRLLRFGPQAVGSIDASFSHLVFDGWRLIMNGLVRLARGAASVNGCPLELPVVSAEKHAELEFHSVETIARLLAIAHELLQQWPDRFIEFSRTNKLSRYDWVRPRENPPYWLHRVVKSKLDMTRYSVTAEEIRGAKYWLEKNGQPIKARDVISTLGLKSPPKSLVLIKRETPIAEIDVERLVGWLDSNGHWGNLGSFVVHRTRAYIGLMLITSLSHKQLCSLKLHRSVSDDYSFASWAYELGVSDVTSTTFRCVAAWYFAYTLVRSHVEEKHSGPPTVFCTSGGCPISVSLAIKSTSRVLGLSGFLPISLGNLKYGSIIRHRGSERKKHESVCS